MDKGGEEMVRVLDRRQAIVSGTAAALGATVPGLAGAQAQGYPQRLVRIICGSAPGGITDLVARIVAERLSPVFKVPVIVENKPGGTGALALEAAANAQPDGYTLVVGFAGANVIYPLLNDKLPFNAERDFAPIIQVSSGGNFLVVHPSLPIKSIEGFIAYVKTQNPAPFYGSWGSGSGGHLAGEYLKIATGIKMEHVSYRSTTALAQEMIGGHIKLGFLDVLNTMVQHKAGAIRAIAQTGPERSSGMQDIPTFKERGVDVDVGVWLGFFGQAKMPQAIVALLNAEIRKVLEAPDLQERWFQVLGNSPAPTTPEQFDAIIKNDFRNWRRVIAEAKISL